MRPAHHRAATRPSQPGQQAPNQEPEARADSRPPPGARRPPRPQRARARRRSPREIRETIITTVATTGGHLGSSRSASSRSRSRSTGCSTRRATGSSGTPATRRTPHKLLTGRLERFGTLRQIDGVGGFPRRSESEHDVFDGGHAGTGLSIAEGLATARDIRGSARADRGRRRRRGAHDRPLASRRSTTSATGRRRC